MELLKKIHRNSDQLDFKSIWSKGIFIFDSNVLLDLYRLPISAREDLINVLKNDKFKDRIWIGFQVLLEFLNNRLEVISDQKNKFNQVKKLTDSTITEYEDTFKNLNLELNKLKLAQRHSLIEPEKYINEANINQGKNFLTDFIGYLDKLEEKQFDVNENDEIKETVLEIFKEKVGKPFDQKALNEIYLLGEKRYKNQIPPGYMDIKKPGTYPYENKEFIRKYGDLLLWNEIIEKCKTEKIEFAVLVTGDVKEDWWQKKRGMRLGARMELLNEIYSNAKDLDTFHMYDTSSFLKYAKQEIDDKIKDSSITETKELIDLSNQERKQKAIEVYKKIKLKQEISEIQSNIHSLQKEIKNTDSYLHRLSNYRDKLYSESKDTDDIREYAHNLGYSESEHEEQKREFEEKLIELEKSKLSLVYKLKEFETDK
jgi:uncharacterized protein (UPF0335 family)